MSPEETERLLESAPTRRLSPEAERRILSAVVACSPAPSVNWWMRRVPLWQAAAACILLCAATFGLARIVSNRGVEQRSIENRPVRREAEATSAALVSLDQPIFGAPLLPSYRLDISKWQFQSFWTE